MGAKGLKTEELIKEKAYALFAKKGFKDVTMTDICEAAGLSRGGLYRHYSSTAEIFKEIISEDSSFNEQISNKESAKAILTEHLNMLEKNILDKEKSLSLAIYEYAGTDKEGYFDSLNKNNKEQYIKLVKYGIKTEEFYDVDVNQIVEILMFYYQGLRMWSGITTLSKETIKNYKRTICDLLINE